MGMVALTEAELKSAVEDYLQYGMNQGKWYYDRLNSGEVIVERGGKKYKIQLCREGTADILVLLKWWPRGAPNKWETIPVFLELKSPKGKQKKKQKEFQEMVEKQGCNYRIIRDLQQVIDLLSDTF